MQSKWGLPCIEINSEYSDMVIRIPEISLLLITYQDKNIYS